MNPSVPQTPLEHYPDLAAAIGASDLYFKREDLHPYGSHKGRSIPPMVESYYKKGDRHFAISSSGNAALAAALAINELNEKNSELAQLDIFVGNHVSPHKLERLKKVAAESDGHIRVLVKERPLQALTQAVNDGMRSLRQSTDDLALVGYSSLAEELAAEKSTAKGAAIFIGTSSGTTAQALAAYFIKKKLPIQVHIVQTSSCHPISDAFGAYEGPDERSDADAITDITGQRKSVLVPLIEKTGGTGWFADNEQIRTALDLVKKHAGLDISANSALSIVGAMQAAYSGYDIKGPAICMICGD